MLSNFTFKATPALVFGAGKLTELPTLAKQFGRRLLIVVGEKSFTSSAAWSELSNKLKSNGFFIHLVHISGEPSPEDIDSACNTYSPKAIDCVVAIGGGSVLDGGKAISAMLLEQQPVITFLEGVGTMQPSGRKLPFIAVPTTSGTGSEATSNAVISQVGNNGFKKSLRHDKYVPDIAIIDPTLTIGCPASLTVACGMDTFTQLVEAYLSSKGSPLSDELALHGIRHVIRSLKTSCQIGEDLAARTNMAYASYLSGIVLANAGLGVIHGFASVIGGLFPVPHGLVCGTLMAAANKITLNTLRRTGENPAALKKYAILGNLLTSSDLADNHAQDLFINYLEDMTTTLNIASLGDFGISSQDIQTIVSQSGNKNNPAQLQHDELAEILHARL